MPCRHPCLTCFYRVVPAPTGNPTLQTGNLQGTLPLEVLTWSQPPSDRSLQMSTLPSCPALAMVLAGMPRQGAHATSLTQSEWPTRGAPSCSQVRVCSLYCHTCTQRENVGRRMSEQLQPGAWREVVCGVLVLSTLVVGIVMLLLCTLKFSVPSDVAAAPWFNIDIHP